MQENKTIQSVTALSVLLNCTICKNSPSSSKNIINNFVNSSCPRCNVLCCNIHEVCPKCDCPTVSVPVLKKIISGHKTLCNIMTKLNIPQEEEKFEKPTRTSNRKKAQNQENNDDIKKEAETHKRNQSVSPAPTREKSSRSKPKILEDFEVQTTRRKRKRNEKVDNVVKVEQKLIPKKEIKEIQIVVKKEDIIKAPKSRRSREKRNFKGETELHEACTAGNEEKAEALLKSGVIPNTRDNAGWTPLHEAVSRNSEKMVRLLLEAGSLPDVPGPGRETPLHEALRTGRYNIAELLVSAGASLKAPDSTGATPLSITDAETAEKLSNITPTCSAMDNMLKIKSEEECKIIRAYIPSLSKKESQKISRLRDGLTFENELTADCTHLIVKVGDNNICRAGRNQLLAVVSGKWIISDKWISELNSDPNADPRRYQITGLEEIPDGVRLARINRYRQLPGIFSGCHIYFAGFRNEYEISSALSVDIRFLRKLVEMGGGVVLRRDPDPEAIPDSEKTVPYHVHPGSPLAKCSHYIIYGEHQEWKPNMIHLKALPVGWLIRCVLRFRLIDPDK